MSSDSSTPSSVDPEAVEQTKRQIRGLVDEISALAKQDLRPDEFYTGFLNRVVEALAAVGGAVWLMAENGQFRLAYQINFRRASLDEDQENLMRHGRLLGQVAESGEGLLVPPHSGAGDESEGANPTELLLVLAPLRSDKQIEGVVEIFQRPTANPATRRGYLRFLLQMCELASEWHKTYKLQEFSSRESLWTQADEFSRVIHDSLDVRLTAYTVANEAQRLIGCDRVSVAIRKGNRCIVEAVSGQDLFDARSNVVVLLGDLATKVIAMSEPLWYTGKTDDLPPQVEEAIQDYVDQSHAKTVVVIPITKPKPEGGPDVDPDHATIEEGEAIGALIFEQIEDIRSYQELAQKVELVSGHSTRALTNAVEHNSLFLMPVWRQLGRAHWLVKGRTLPKTLAALIGVVTLLLFLAFFPSDFNLKGRGELQPILRRDVFAEDGKVTRILVKHGDLVAKGDVLVELDNTELEVRIEGVQGQIDETGAQIEAAGRQQRNPSISSDDRNFYAAERRELGLKADNLLNQMRLYTKLKDDLKIRSPIDGQIVTWEVEHLLQQRSVNRGEVLMTVADSSGPWELEVSMAENRIGHITKAVKGQESNLEVEYISATNPNARLVGKVRDIHRAAELQEEHGHIVRIMVDINKEDLTDPRPGATVTAKIHCGRRSIGYVWLHELFEWFQSRVLFLF